MTQPEPVGTSDWWIEVPINWTSPHDRICPQVNDMNLSWHGAARLRKEALVVIVAQAWVVDIIPFSPIALHYVRHTRRRSDTLGATRGLHRGRCHRTFRTCSLSNRPPEQLVSGSRSQLPWAAHSRGGDVAKRWSVLILTLKQKSPSWQLFRARGLALVLMHLSSPVGP